VSHSYQKGVSFGGKETPTAYFLTHFYTLEATAKLRFYFETSKKNREKAWRFGKIIVNLQMETKD